MKYSCGILLYKMVNDLPMFLLAHPGGEHNSYSPWGCPKGQIEDGETPFECAKREFKEETGHTLNGGKPIDLGSVASDDKTIHIFAIEQDLDVKTVKSNIIDFYWKGTWIKVPEIDEVRWMDITRARYYVSNKQISFVEDLYKMLMLLGVPVQNAAIPHAQ